MENATAYYISDDKTTEGAQTTIAPSKPKRIQRLDATGQGHKRNQKRQAQICTGEYAAHDFLKTTFLPKLEQTEATQIRCDTAKLERDFYQSLSQLAELNNILPTETRFLEYPYNIATALTDLQDQLSKKAPQEKRYRLLHHKNDTFFATEENYNTESTLYYIPITPLYLMLKDRDRKLTARLLLSVCSYLYRIADIPFYRQEGTYLFDTYEMLKQWNEEEADGDDDYLKEHSRAEYTGDRMERKLKNPKNLVWFKTRLEKFQCRDALEKDCLSTATTALQLYDDYPTTSIYNKIQSTNHADDDYQGYEITLDKYISFYASGCGYLSDSLFDTVNNDLQEYSSIEEPIIYKPIDGRIIEGNNFDFEQRLFALISDLTTILYDYEKHHHERHNK